MRPRPAPPDAPLRPLTVVLTAAGGLGLPGIIDCLRANGEREIRVVVTDTRTDVPSRHLADAFYQIPPADDPAYVATLVDLCVAEGADVVVPLASVELLPVATERERFVAIGCVPLVNRPAVVSACDDKLGLYNALAGAQTFRVPRCRHVVDRRSFEDAASELGFPTEPICFKPRRSLGGSKGFRVVDGVLARPELLFADKPTHHVDWQTVLRSLDGGFRLDHLVMEYVPGAEYSTDVLADRGRVVSVLPRLRVQVEMGFSISGRIVDQPSVAAACEEAARRLSLSYANNVQLRLDPAGELVLMEVNPRLSGTVASSQASGVNLPYLAVKMALRESLIVPKPMFGVTMLRYWKELYF